MGLTTSDMHQIMYANYRREGFTHRQILDQIPADKRKQFIADIDKTAIESHFGIKDHWFFIILGIGIFGMAVLALMFQQIHP